MDFSRPGLGQVSVLAQQSLALEELGLNVFCELKEDKSKMMF